MIRTLKVDAVLDSEWKLSEGTTAISPEAIQYAVNELLTSMEEKKVYL